MKLQQVMADKEEFITIIQENKAVIYKICYIYSHSQEELADLYQEVVLNLWLSWPGFRKESKAITWIYRVGLNTCVSFVRKDKRRIKALPLKTDINLFDESNHEFDALQELYKMIDCLNKLEKTLILLWLEERSYEEIALITGLSRSNVAVKLLRIKEKLKQMSDK